MKVTNFGDGIPVALDGWSSGVTSINSNATTTDGGLSALYFVQRITSNGSNTLLNPSVNFAAGSNVALSAASNTITITSILGGTAPVRVVEFVIDGGGSAITTGIKGDVEVPFAWSDIVSARLFADQSGSIVINVWKDIYANFPPDVSDKITASAPPTISSATKSQDTTLTGWTKTGSAGDVLRFNVDSASTIARVTISLVLVPA